MAVKIIESDSLEEALKKLKEILEEEEESEEKDDDVLSDKNCDIFIEKFLDLCDFLANSEHFSKDIVLFKNDLLSSHGFAKRSFVKSFRTALHEPVDDILRLVAEFISIHEIIKPTEKEKVASNKNKK